ncbi:MAG TPA: glycosyltransferase [Candidatus Dormibacteraeota bacterium]|nr:glycosyltransferase [Candidatus Dormibacteraeota bacterium]
MRRAVAVAWCDFQPRTVALAEAFGGRAHFISGSRLQGRGFLLPLRYLRDAVVAWQTLSRERPKVVFAITPPVFSPLVAWLWCRLHGGSLVIDCHTEAFHSRRWGWALPIHRWLCRRAAAVTLHNDVMYQEAEAWGAPAVLLPDELPDPGLASPVVAPAGPQVVVAGSLDTQEPIAEALEAARLVPGVEFLVTGDTARLPAGMVENAPANVTFTGWLDYGRFLGHLAAADVVAAFSLDPHIMNRAAFEAIAVGRPLVLSAHEGLQSRFGEAAVYCANSAPAMAAAIEQAIDSADQLALRAKTAQGRLQADRETGINRLKLTLRHADARGGGRVLMISQHPYPTNPTLRRNVDYLVEQGHRVDLVSIREKGGAVATPKAGLRIYTVPLTHKRDSRLRYPLEFLWFFVAAMPRVLAMSLTRRYAAVQVDNLPDFLVFLGGLARWRGARLVFFMFELMPEMTVARLRTDAQHRVVRLATRIEGWATRYADQVVVVNGACERALIGRGVPAEKLSVIYNTQPGALVTGLRIARREVLVTHATLVQRYGVQVAIEALARLSKTHPDLVLEVLGEGEYRGELERLAAELGLSHRVDFLGYLPWNDAMARIRQASVGIVAVLDDGYGRLMLPMKLLDYASQGVPAVCSRLEAVEEYFGPGAVAYFDPGDAAGLAEGVERLLADRQGAAAQAQQARTALERLSWETVSDRYLGVLGATA